MAQFRAASRAGDDVADVWIKQYGDADLASDIRTRRRTSANTEKLWGAQHQGAPELQHAETDRYFSQYAGG